MAEDDGFLSRWSRRKVVARSVEQAGPEPAPTPETSVEPTTAAVRPLPTVVDESTQPAVAQPEAKGSKPDPTPLTLTDVAKLTRDSDYSPFVARDVSPDVRNAALKRLFTDPHYNVMDGLDTYIDDYGKPDPLPEGMLRQMTQTAFLGLFDKPAEDDVLAQSPPQPPDSASPDDAVVDTESSASIPPDTEPDEDPDLRLQPDDATGRSGPDPSPDEDQRRER